MITVKRIKLFNKKSKKHTKISYQVAPGPNRFSVSISLEDDELKAFRNMKYVRGKTYTSIVRHALMLFFDVFHEKVALIYIKDGSFTHRFSHIFPQQARIKPDCIYELSIENGDLNLREKGRKA